MNSHSEYLKMVELLNNMKSDEEWNSTDNQLQRNINLLKNIRYYKKQSIEDIEIRELLGMRKSNKGNESSSNSFSLGHSSKSDEHN